MPRENKCPDCDGNGDVTTTQAIGPKRRPTGQV